MKQAFLFVLGLNKNLMCNKKDKERKQNRICQKDEMKKRNIFSVDTFSFPIFFMIEISSVSEIL